MASSIPRDEEPSNLERSRDPADFVAEIRGKPGHLLRRAHQMSTSIFIEQGKEFDLTPVQYGSLQIVDAYPGLDQATVGRLMGLDRTTLSDVVRRMVAKGLLIRKEHNRRSMTLYLSGAGRALLEVMADRMEGVNNAILTPLDPVERQTFLTLLTKILKEAPSHDRLKSKAPRETS